MKKLKKPTRKMKELIAEQQVGRANLNPNNWLIERHVGNQVVCVNRKSMKKLVIEI
ncbi:hypothetical protein M2139_000536 [Enterococcus sp. PF1-24]|uniref:DUF6906 family protein n=1 Tax=unclassified Enterococcus TaxID=2608891 RepID=UPI002475860D|nr:MULTISPECIES: hypothetical protein [unclassified Enterococcus]MDH6363699.1 hypothetical protein [Enterococcus sp. PFB1-1]MDH6400655.1 hypothetical protein [Enterococcus sp. PF1-24]